MTATATGTGVSVEPDDWADVEEEPLWMLDDREPEVCPPCGKEYEDFSDLGCGFCDRRSPEWGLLP